MSMSVKRRADAALSGHVWAVGIAIAATGFLAACVGIIGWYPAKLVWGAEHSWIGHVAVAAVLAAAIALALLIRLRIAQADVIRGARFLLPVGIDGLTGLSNRSAFCRAFEELLAAADGRSGLSLMLLDLDMFKEINDTYGHHAGDVVLTEVGRRLRYVCGPEPVIGRLGGDEFAVLVQGASSTADIAAACNLIIEAVRKPILCDGQVLTIGVSIGFVSSDGTMATRDDLMRKADRALYAAKAQGRNCALPFDLDMDKDLTQRRFLERELRGAIINGEIDIDLQPILSADGGAIEGAEALARWNHGYRGRIMPAEFIPLAESAGLIHQLGEVVLRRACQAAARWDGLFISVNVSPIQMKRPDFVTGVKAVLAETGLQPQRLVLEITEGVMIDDPDHAQRLIGEIRALGVKIALDDFGTGFSSLSYLRKFGLDTLKVDRSFVVDLDNGAGAAAILHCVVNLGRALGLKVIAEGVETQDHARFLRAAGCHQMQGYLFGRPMPLRELEARYGLAAAERRASA
jgi:diguanylate cyclase (GGDEF)-like protein